MKKAFGYLRVSGKGQVDGDGFPRQRTAIEKYAKAHDITITRWFEEEGVTGEAPGEQRPAWARMWNALEANGTRTIVIEQLDRLARKLLVQETLLADLQKNGFELISTREPDLNSDDESRVLMRQIHGAMAQYEKTKLVTRMKAARDRASSKAGRRVEGRKAYGTRPGEQDVITRMRKLASGGASYVAVATALNDSRLRPRSGKAWYAMTVRNILKRS